MKYIQVSIKDKNTLILEEDGTKGDYIDLTSVTSFDSTMLEKCIEEGKDIFYKKKLEEEKKNLSERHTLELKALEKEMEAKSKEEIAALNRKILTLQTQNSNDKINAQNSETIHLNELEKKKNDEINKLQNELSSIKAQLASEKEKYRLEIENKYQKEISEQKQQITELTLKSQAKEENYQKDLATIKAESAKEKADLESKYSTELSTIKDNASKEKEELSNQLREAQRLRSTSTIKVIGEDLETWCDREVTSYMQAGFLNCTWDKDNTVVKEDGESKGSKADYIFRIYADASHKDLLSSVILDMKSESLVSVNKKRNQDHFAQLAKNREKKGCKYAVLVSELEMDKSNDIPIFRVIDPNYPDMYVVRPQYLTTFLSMITSLSTKFSALILQANKDNIEFQEKQKIIDQLLSYKNTYLDKPLATMKNDIETILDSSSSIRKACSKIDETVDHIKSSYINNINDKLERYETCIRKEVKKIKED